MRFKLSFILLLICISSFCGAQKLEPASYQISSKDGLPDMQIYKMLEDDEQYIWLATNSGIYKYDGKDFILFVHEKQKGSSAFGIEIDLNGNLWYNNGYGQIFNIVDEEVILRHEFDRKPLAFIENINIYEDKIFINGPDEILVFDSKDYSSVINEYNKKILPSTNIITTDKGNYVLKGDYFFKINDNGYILNNKNVSEILNQKSKGFLIKENTDVFMLLPLEGKNIFYDTNAFSILKDSFKEIENTTINHYRNINSSHWFLTSSGAFEYIYDNGKFILINRYFDDLTITDVIYDYYGNLVFSTLNSGLFIIPDKDLKVLSFNERLAFRNINRLTIGQNGNIYFISDNKLLHKYIKEKNIIKSIPIPRHQNQLLYYDYKTSELILYNKNEISIWNENMKIIRSYSNHETPKDFIRSSDTTFFAAYYNRVEVTNDDFKPFNLIPLRSSHVATAIDNRLYYSSINGLHLTDVSLERNIPIYIDNQKLTSSRLINEEKSDYVWAVHGSNILKIKEDRVVDSIMFPITSSKNFIIDVTSNKEYLFIASNNGLLRHNKISKKQTGYFNSIINKRKKIIGVKVEGNNLWLTNGEKLYSLNTDFSNLSDDNRFNVYAKKIEIDDSLVSGNSFITNTSSTININLWVNRLGTVGRYKYFYKFKDEKDWHEVAENSSAIMLNNLEAGNQILQIQAKDIYTLEESIIEELDFEVVPPFYLQWWFLLGILFIMFVVVVYLLRFLNKIKERKWQRKFDKVQNDRKMTQLQLENLRSQMNPHFLFNALNSLQDHIIGNEKKEASKFLVKFSRLMRMYLDHSQYDKVSLHQEVEALSLYLFLENKRFNNQLSYTIHIDQNIDVLKTKVPSLFIQPYIENALLHGLRHKTGDKNLSVDFKVNSDYLICMITDNGVGREKAAEINLNNEYKSFATAANESRLELINSQESERMSVVFEDISTGNEKGTKVIITLKHEV